MASNSHSDNAFIARLTDIVEANLTNSQFGVSGLAREAGMSRASLHRKVNSITKISASQFISQVRLKKAKEILQFTSNTVTDVAYQVGYKNVSYFIKCFHDYYGYSPGKARNMQDEEETTGTLPDGAAGRTKVPVMITAISALLLAVVMIIVFKPFSGKRSKLEKTIAIIPPYIEQKDSSYAYYINGTIKNVINNLSMISEIERVVPWTSVLQYKNEGRSVNEIALEQKANYIVESSAFIAGNKIYLDMNLIEGGNNKQIWSTTFPFTIDSTDVISAYQDISREIAREINAKITPEEGQRINKIPTSNKAALNYYLEGLEKQRSDPLSAIRYFERAVDNDEFFALAFAELSNTYYLMQRGSENLDYSAEINRYADKALMLDNEHDICLIAKAQYYIIQREYEWAIDILEKAVEYNPNSAIAYRHLANMHSVSFGADPEKRLEYALKALEYRISEKDSLIRSRDYRLVAWAFRELGFYAEAIKNLEIATELNPDRNAYKHEEGEILIDHERKYEAAIELLEEALEQDTMQRLVTFALYKNYYHVGDYQNALMYYRRLKSNFNFQPDGLHLSRIALMYAKLGMKEESNACIRDFENLINLEKVNDYRKVDLVIRLHCLKNETSAAIEQLQILNRQEQLFGNTIRLLEDEPIYENIRQYPEFQEVLSDMRSRFWTNHERIQAILMKKGLI